MVLLAQRRNGLPHSKVHRVLPEQMVLLALLVQMALMVLQAQKDLWALLVQKVQWVLLEPMALQDHKEPLDLLLGHLLAHTIMA